MTFLKTVTRSTLATALVFSGTIVAGSLSDIRSAQAAEPIAGVWKNPKDGRLIRYSGKGTRYCATVLNGKFKGKSIGCMTGKGKNYKGKLTVLSEGKTYSGKAAVTGNRMKLSGCVAGGLFCRGVTMVRQ